MWSALTWLPPLVAPRQPPGWCTCTCPTLGLQREKDGNITTYTRVWNVDSHYPSPANTDTHKCWSVDLTCPRNFVYYRPHRTLAYVQDACTVVKESTLGTGHRRLSHLPVPRFDGGANVPFSLVLMFSLISLLHVLASSELYCFSFSVSIRTLWISSLTITGRNLCVCVGIQW